jgi:subtilisin family serine protease
MNSKKIIFIIIIAAALSLPAQLTASIDQVCDETQAYVKNRVVIKVSMETGDASSIQDRQIAGKGQMPGKISRQDRLARMLSYKFPNQVKGLSYHPHTGYYFVQTADGCDVEALSEKLRRESEILDASPDYLASFGAVSPPNDEFFQNQYALHNTGQVYLPEFGNSGTAGSDINALEGWEWTTGTAEVIIAVVDSGVATNHEDLVNKIVPGYDFINNTVDAYDDHGHGTLVASIAAAETDNTVGIAGVSWNALIMPVKVMRNDGYGSYTTIAAGIEFAADHGAQVINLSIGGRGSSFILEDACQYAYEKGAVIVACNGNYSYNVLYPAAYDDYVLAIAATGADDEWAPFSNRGPQTDVAAPGYFVWGAKFSPHDADNLSNYNWGSGTSYATPYVSGAAALLISYKPFLTNAQVMDLIRHTADDINADTFPGADDYLGYGRINLGRLLAPYPLPAN